MALTGGIISDDGAIHPQAYGTEMQIRSGANMVESIVGQMQVMVKQDLRFTAWVDTA